MARGTIRRDAPAVDDGAAGRRSDVAPCLCERGGADARAHGPGRAVRCSRLEADPSGRRARRKPAARARRRCDRRRPHGAGDSRRSVTSPRPCSRVSVRSASTPAWSRSLSSSSSLSTLAVRESCRRREPRGPTPRQKGWLGAMALVVLVAVQMALAFVLIAATSLAMRAVGDLRGRDVGINPAGLLSADVYLPRDPYVTRNVSGTGSAEIAEFSPAGAALYDRIRAALQTTPGVVQAAGVGTHPFAANPFVQFWIGDLEHTPDNRVAAQYLAVTENYFNTMGIRLVRGRDFSAADRPDSPWVVLVNETLAKQHWPDGDPIGQRLTLTFSPNDEEAAREVIGLVADTIPFRGASEVPPLIYVLHRQQAAQQRASLEGRRTVMSFIVRTAGDPLALGDAVRAQVGKVDAATPVASIRTVESYLNAGQTALLQYGETLLGIFALVALVAGAVSVYALTAYGVAHRQSVLTLGLFVVAAVVIGAAAGWAGWMRLADVIASFLTNLTVTPSDPIPLVVTGGMILVTALVVFLLGARRPTTAGR